VRENKVQRVDGCPDACPLHTQSTRFVFAIRLSFKYLSLPLV